MTPRAIKNRLDIAGAAAEEAARVILDYYHQPKLKVHRKDDASPVTAADREAESVLRNRIAEAFPKDGILGEEQGETPGTSGWRWILDPIDGTKSFIHGVPLFGTLIAVEYEDQPVVGLIHFPALEEMVYAARGEGAWWVRASGETRRARVSDCEQLSEALVCATDTGTYGDRRPVVDALQAAAKLSRTWGDCYGYALVATGRAEVMLDPAMKIWDAAAMLPILEEAGGTFTDWKGNATVRGNEGVATNGLLLKETLVVLGGGQVKP